MICFSPGGDAGFQEGRYKRLQTGREEQGSWEASMGGFRLVGRSRVSGRLAGRHCRKRPGLQGHQQRDAADLKGGAETGRQVGRRDSAV